LLLKYLSEAYLNPALVKLTQYAIMSRLRCSCHQA